MERQMIIGLVLTVAAAVLVMAFAFRQPAMQQEQLAKQINMEMNEGGHLFVTNQCYTCHGNQGQGLIGPRIAAAPGLTEEVAIKAITQGRANSKEECKGQPAEVNCQAMPSFSDAMRAHQIEALAYFLVHWDQGRIDNELFLKAEQEAANKAATK